MRRTLIFAACTAAGFGRLAAQDVIEWDGTYQLELTDFRSPATRIGEGSLYSLQSAAGFDFLFHMSQGEFMFTKNFNQQGQLHLPTRGFGAGGTGQRHRPAGARLRTV